jgi:hypothetical protein
MRVCGMADAVPRRKFYTAICRRSCGRCAPRSASHHGPADPAQPSVVQTRKQWPGSPSMLPTASADSWRRAAGSSSVKRALMSRQSRAARSGAARTPSIARSPIRGRLATKPLEPGFRLGDRDKGSPSDFDDANSGKYLGIEGATGDTSDCLAELRHGVCQPRWRLVFHRFQRRPGKPHCVRR